MSYDYSQGYQAEDERIYILGTGSCTDLFAHSLATKPSPPPITLMWCSSSFVQTWNDSEKGITIKRNKSFDKRNAFDAEFLAPNNDPVLVGGQIGRVIVCTNLIKNLIVCKTDKFATDMISSIKHRLNEQSTILFALNSFSKQI